MKCEESNEKCEEYSVKYEVWSAKSAVGNMKCGVGRREIWNGKNTMINGKYEIEFQIRHRNKTPFSQNTRTHGLFSRTAHTYSIEKN